MVFGVDEVAVVVRTAFEDFVVRVRRFGSVLSREEQQLADWAATQFRLGIDIGDPGLTSAARQLERLLDGDRFMLTDGFGNRDGFGLGDRTLDPFALGRAELAFGGPAARIADALRSGRLVVERTRVESLTDLNDFEPPELPPLPPLRREASTHTFEVRFLDEVGKAIAGIDAEFTADGPQTRPTNAAGIALLEGVVSSRADVAILDPEALSKVLDPRWETLRPGSPPKESNTREVVFHGGELGPFDLKAELPNTVVIKPPLGKLFVELWDKTGRVRHANRTYKITGPQSFEGTTDQDGRLLHENVFPGDYQLSLALDFFEEGDPDRSMDIVDSPLVVLRPNDAAPQVRMLGAVPRSTLVRLQLFFNTNKVFLLPTALPGVKTLRRLYRESSPCKLLAVGHCDTTADPSYNDKLSLERAKATIAYLADDVEAWLKYYEADNHPKQRWGKAEDHSMIIAMPGFTTKPKGEDPVRWYQRTRGLEVDGVAGKQTRRALIEEYMSLDGASLRDFVGAIDATPHGCGESFPLDETGESLDPAPADSKRDAIDRRVELFFFDDEFGITPKPAGPNSKAGSPEYPLWRQRVAQTIELRADALDAPRVTFVELSDAHFRSGSAVLLPEGEAPDDNAGHAAFTSVGLIATALRFNEENSGRTALVAGHTDTSAGDELNDELSRERAKVALALLEGDRESFKKLANKRHRDADINQILSWLSQAFGELTFDCNPGKITGSVSDANVRNFQRAFNTNKAELGSSAPDLVIDGSVGENTWGAFFDCYEFGLRQELGEDAAGVAALRSKLKFADPERKSLGFGERFPIEELGVDNFRSQTNRRVEVLFFEPGQEPDLAHAERDPETSELYLPGFFSREPLDALSSAKQADRAIGLRVTSRFSLKKSFPKPSALPALRAAIKLLEERPELNLVVVGHTDPVGSDANNFELSLSRAAAVRAWLTGDRAFFVDQFSRTTEAAWSFEEVQWMLHGIEIGGAPCYVGEADGFAGRLTSDALGRFQLNASDLAVSYVADQPTVERLVDAYIGLLGGTVSRERIEVVGGGSWCPPRKFFGGGEPAADPLLRDLRRVELFFFAAPPRPPVARFPRQRAAPVVYERWCNQTGQELSVAAPPFRIQAYDPSSILLPNTTIQLAQVVDQNGTVALGSVTTDALGCAAVPAPPGTIFAQARFGSATVTTAFELDPDASCGAALAFGIGGGLESRDNELTALELAE